MLRRHTRRQAITVAALAGAAVAGLVVVLVTGVDGRRDDVGFARSPGAGEPPTPSEPIEPTEPGEGEAPAEPEGTVDADVSTAAPERAVVGMLQAPTCEDPGGLPEWTAAQLGGAASGFTAVDPARAFEDVPLLRTPLSDGSCLVAGAVVEARSWELRDAAGVVLGRLGSAPIDEADIPFEAIWDDEEARYASIASGQDLVGHADGDHIDAYLTMGAPVQEGPPPPTRRLVGELPGIRTEETDPHHRASQLLDAMMLAPLVEVELPATPRRMVEGFLRCVGPPQRHSEPFVATVFCDAHGATIELAGPIPLGTGALVEGIWVDEPPAVPVPIDGRQGERIDLPDGRYELRLRRGTLPGYELRAIASAALSQDQVAAVLASTEVPLIQSGPQLRAEPVDEPDPVDHRDAFDAAWVQELLEDVMGRGVQVTRSRRLDRAWQQVSVMMSAPDGSLLVTVVFTYPRGTVPSQADATCGGVAFDVLGARGSFDPDPLPAIVDGFLQQLGCAGP